ncbi:hypothetical protein O181_109723 [Austropuccinia psidii MF-1]|uniref:Uncharacterized protein n=1 Tax=Austropuccinia psidii MF-1 TaxID=1389203 RepID=A0A9Q3JVA3_9BASI|nr:hypothetical protein [Austropuccinia psidii MF-1]
MFWWYLGYTIDLWYIACHACALVFSHRLTNSDGLSRWSLPNTPENPDYVPSNAEPQIPIEEINITYVETDVFEEVRKSHMQDKNFHLLTSLLSKFRKTPAMLEEGWDPKLPFDTFKKGLVDINPTDSILKLLLDKVRNHANKNISDNFEYYKKKWDKSHKIPEVKLGDLELVSTLNFNDIKGPKKF